MTNLLYRKNKERLASFPNIVTSGNGSADFGLQSVKAVQTDSEKRPLRSWTSMKYDSYALLGKDLSH